MAGLFMYTGRLRRMAIHVAPILFQVRAYVMYRLRVQAFEIDSLHFLNLLCYSILSL